MGEADLRLHLAKQGLAGVASLDYRAYEAGDPGRALDDVLRAGPPAVLMDVSRADDLPVIGRLIWAHALRSPLLAVGASSVAQALAAAWPDGALSPRGRAAAPASSGPVFLMVGSLSPVTRAQVEAAPSFERIDVDGARLVDDAALAQSVRADAVKSLRQGRNVMVATDRPDGAPQRAARWRRPPRSSSAWSWTRRRSAAWRSRAATPPASRCASSTSGVFRTRRGSPAAFRFAAGAATTLASTASTSS